MSFCTPKDIILITNSKPIQFHLEKEDTEGLNKILEEWIGQAENLIEEYCETTFTDPIPLGVKNVCIRLVSNMVTFKSLREDSPIIKVNDWNTELVSSEIFSDDLKNDLKPFRKKKKIQVFKI